MDDAALQQRIKYLVEHGGLWDDPIARIARRVDRAMVVALLCLLLHAVELARLLR